MTRRLVKIFIDDILQPVETSNLDAVLGKLTDEEVNTLAADVLRTVALAVNPHTDDTAFIEILKTVDDALSNGWS